ncbi:MAG: hypothetical protein M1548_06860 [Actinobacteria bacterium]|nr:hypothetical protein [Chloroflexota bacterium]MCL5292231.1 hypothetical protein [Actinomycetota bacterium]
MLVKALFLPLIIILLMFGSVFFVRIVRALWDNKLLIIPIPIAFIALLFSGMSGAVKLVIALALAGVAFLVVNRVRQSRLSG